MHRHSRPGRGEGVGVDPVIFIVGFTAYSENLTVLRHAFKQVTKWAEMAKHIASEPKERPFWRREWENNTTQNKNKL